MNIFRDYWNSEGELKTVLKGALLSFFLLFKSNITLHISWQAHGVQALTIKTNTTMAQKSLPSWSLVAFARQYGKMQVGSFVNEEGTPFKSCIFTDADGSKRFVGFSQKLGVLSPAEIASRKDELQIVLTENGKYKLCKKGNPGEAWEDVDLGI